MFERLASIAARVRFAWERRRLAAETRAEIDEHLDLLAARYQRAGMTPSEAHAAARRQFGNIALTREEVYRLNGIGWIDDITQDFRDAVRQVRRSPGYATVVAATLALGIGGTTAVFSVLYAVLLAPLPYEEPGRLVRIYQAEPGRPETRHYLTGAHFSMLREHAASFESAAALNTYSEVGRDLVVRGEPTRIRVLAVTSDYFVTLRARVRGPAFDRHDEAGTRRVVLSAALSRAAFGGNQEIVGRTIQLSAEPYEVVGIAPAGFDDPIGGAFDAWIPYELSRDTNEQNNSLTVIARLRAGVSLRQAEAELEALSRSMRERWPRVRLSGVAVFPLHEDLVAEARAPLHVLSLAVVLVLLVACVNVANLALTRSTGRVHEFATRAAIGAGTRRLVRQCFAESLLLGALGGVLGLAVAAIGVTILKRLGGDTVPRLDEVSLDPAALQFAALVTIITAVAFGTAPAVRLLRIAPIDALREQSRSTTGTRGHGRLRMGLAAAQLALALTLLVGAGALVGSFHRLNQVDLGIRMDDVLTFDVNLPSVRYNAQRRTEFQEELSRRLGALPGVTAAGAISFLPTTGQYHGWTTSVLTGPRAGAWISSGTGFNIQQRTISGNLFAALGIPMLAGRAFDGRDTPDAPMRVIVSANFADAAFPGMSFDRVIGQRIAAGGRSAEIIGIVGNTTTNVYGRVAVVVYHPHRQFAANRNWALTHVVASSRQTAEVLHDVRATIAALDRELVVYRAAPMADVVGHGSRRETFALALMAAFAGVSLLLAALGLYGVLAFAVRQRTPEIGIRLALGATGRQVRALVLRQASAVLGVGLAIGTVGAFVLARSMTTVFFETSLWDPRIFAAAATLLTGTGFIAAWLPARRASRLAPTIAVRL
jgi:putative ABC transport system permease protein